MSSHVVSIVNMGSHEAPGPGPWPQFVFSGLGPQNVLTESQPNLYLPALVNWSWE